MKLTNRLNLPDAILKAVQNDSYSKGDSDYSVTQLLNPARKLILEKRHWDDLTEDVSERLYSLYGQVTHGILERSNTDNDVVIERRLKMGVKGYSISGGMDSFRVSNGKLTDYKFVSVYKMKNGVPEEYTLQLNCYAELLRRNNIDVKELEIIAIFRDYSVMEAKRDQNYPQLPVVVAPVPLYDSARTTAWMETRVREIKEAETKLPLCTPEERWARPAKFAVKKKGVDKAVRLFNTIDEAKVLLDEKGNTHFIEHRPGESVRCENYCKVNRFCDQFISGRNE